MQLFNVYTFNINQNDTLLALVAVALATCGKIRIGVHQPNPRAVYRLGVVSEFLVLLTVHGSCQWLQLGRALPR